MSLNTGYEGCDRVNVDADGVPTCNGSFDQHCAASAKRVEYIVSGPGVFVDQFPDDRGMELGRKPEDVVCQTIKRTRV